MTDYVKTLIKDPDDVVDYVMNFTAWLEGDTIASATVTPDPGLTLASQGATTTHVTAWLSGGTVNEYYDVLFRIVTAAGRTKDCSIQFHIRQR